MGSEGWAAGFRFIACPDDRRLPLDRRPRRPIPFRRNSNGAVHSAAWHAAARREAERTAGYLKWRAVDRLWRGRISFLKDGKITSFREGDGFPAGLVRTIAIDGDGVVWAAVVGGLARFDGNHWEKIQMGWNYPGTTAFSIVIDHEGTVWVTSENAVFFLPRGKKQFQDAGLSTRSGVLLLAPDNLFWLTEPHSNSIVQLQIQSGKLRRSQTLIQASDWTPIFDHNGGLWIGSWGDGILHIPSPSMLPKGTTSKLSSGAETFTEADGLSHNRATSWLEDRERNIWIATNAGLDRLRRSGVSWSPFNLGHIPSRLSLVLVET